MFMLDFIEIYTTVLMFFLRMHFSEFGAGQSGVWFIMSA